MTGPGHHNQNHIRNTLRKIGPFVLGIGVIFFAIGVISFFTSFGNFEGPRYFWCSFVGLPLIFVGVVLSQFGYMGSVGRYVAGEMAPVAKDTANYIATESKDTIRHVSEAIGAGLNQGRGSMTTVRCTKCSAENKADAKFCNSCGTALSKPCTHCGELNSADARFCDKCGRTF